MTGRIELDTEGGELVRLRVGLLDVAVGGLYHRFGPLLIPDGLHLWWGNSGVHVFWRHSPRVIWDRDEEFAA
jgi:hypothetical protein